MGQASRDENHVTTLLAVSSVDGVTPVTLYADPITHRLLVDAAGGTGTVTSVSVVTANGFAGSVATATTTPAITITTSVTGLLKGNGTAMAAAVQGTDYYAPGGTDVALADGGTGQSLSDPGFNAVQVWDDTLNQIRLAAISGITYNSGTNTLSVSAGGTGTVTSVSVVTANGFAGTVATATTTPAITLTTSITGILKGNGTAISAASDGTDYLSSTTGITVSQGTPQTLGVTGSRLLKLWATDITVTNAITGSVTGNAGTATALQNARTIGGVSFDGTANITVATATGGFTVSGGNLALGTNSITMSGSIGVTGTRVTKLWATDVESTNMYTVGGTSLSSTFAALAGSTAQAFSVSTIDIGNADTTIARVSAGVISVEGVTVPTISSTSTITNKRNQPRVVSSASYTTDTGTSLDVSTCDLFIVTAQAGALKFNNPSGTPVQGEKLTIRIKDNGTARALTFDTQFRASSDLALPTTTIISKTLYMGFIYNSTDTKWDMLALLNNF